MPERPAPFIEASNPPENILVVKPSSLGDVVHTLPAVALVKQRWPTAKVRWLVNTEWMPLLKGNPDLTEVLEFPRRDFRGLRGLTRIAPWARRLREKAGSDLVLDFQGLLRSALISRLCRKAGGNIVGLSDAREGATRFYDAVVDVSGIDHAVDRYLAMVNAFGHMPDETLDWKLPMETPADARTDLVAPFVLLHPFSRGEGKSLTREQVAQFCRAMAPTRVLVAGRTDENIEPAPNVVDYLNRTELPELIHLIRRAHWVVSVDSGPMHIAAALGGRLVSIHTWSDPLKVGPYSPSAWIWQGGEVWLVKNDAARLAVRNIADLAQFVRERWDVVQDV